METILNVLSDRSKMFNFAVPVLPDEIKRDSKKSREQGVLVMLTGLIKKFVKKTNSLRILARRL